MSGGFGAPFVAQSRDALKRQATPPSGSSPEAIWHQVYDTQTYTDNTTTSLTFFAAAQTDPTLGNLPTSGVFPSPQIFKIHNICVDFIHAVGVSTSATTVGNINDLYLLMFVGRPVWTLNISDKTYGPYKLTALHGTGSLNAQLSSTVATVSQQFGTNTPVPGWNYYGRIIIPEQNNFNIRVAFAAAQDLTADVKFVVSMFGVLSRRVL